MILSSEFTSEFQVSVKTKQMSFMTKEKSIKSKIKKQIQYFPT